MVDFINFKHKLRTYVQYKDSFIIEEVIKYCLKRRKSSIIAQIRIGILSLHLETRRFRNVKVEEGGFAKYVIMVM